MVHAAAAAPLPAAPPIASVDLPTRPEQALLYRLNGDLNPLHSDPGVAGRAGFPRPILHGMCTFGIVTRAVLASRCDYRPERIGALSMRFRAPVYPGETLRIDLWADGALRVRALEREAIVVCTGHATLDAAAEAACACLPRAAAVPHAA